MSSMAAVVSLALGLFQDFGTSLPAGDPPVDWVEGVAIIIATLIVVSRLRISDVSTLHYDPDHRWLSWRLAKGTPVRGAQSKEGRAYRNGKEHLIDVKVRSPHRWSPFSDICVS